MAEEKVVGWFQGRMEFGPRALGGRSILGDARSARMQSLMNLKIKFRESFRPFAPSVLEERVDDISSAPARAQSLHAAGGAGAGRQAAAAGRARSAAPRARQAADALLRRPGRHARRLFGPRPDGRPRRGTAAYYRLLKEFEPQTGCPVMINTSFNVRGEPIVCTPEQAYRCFLATDMDALVLEDFVLLKADQPHAREHEIDEYLAQFQLD